MSFFEPAFSKASNNLWMHREGCRRKLGSKVKNKFRS